MLLFVRKSFPKANLALIDDPFAFAQVQAFTLALLASFTVGTRTACAAPAGRYRRPTHSIEAIAAQGARVGPAAPSAISRRMSEGARGDGRRYTICAPISSPWRMAEKDGVVPSRIPTVGRPPPPHVGRPNAPMGDPRSFA